MMKKADSSSIGSYRRLPGSSRRSVQNESTLLDLYGRIYAGQFFGEKKELDANGDIKNEYSDKQGANQFVRLGAKVESEINRVSRRWPSTNCRCTSTTARRPSARTPTTCVPVWHSPVSAPTGDRHLRSPEGAPGFLADWTDVSLSDGYGNEALGAKTDTFATNRAGSVLKYSGLFNGFQVDTSYKFDGGDTEETSSKDSDAAYGAAVAYTFPFNLSLGTAYNVGIRDKSGEEDAKLWLLSAKYDNKALYAALSYADGSDFLATGKGSHRLGRGAGLQLRERLRPDGPVEQAEGGAGWQV